MKGIWKAHERHMKGTWKAHERHIECTWMHVKCTWMHMKCSGKAKERCTKGTWNAPIRHIVGTWKAHDMHPKAHERQMKCTVRHMKGTWKAHDMHCDDTGMYHTVRSANPTYRERESTRIDQVVDPIAHDSINPFWHLSGTQTPRIRVPNRTHNKPILQSINLNTYFIFKALYSVVLPSQVVVYDIE